VQKKDQQEAADKAEKEAAEARRALDEQQRLATEALQSSIVELLQRGVAKQKASTTMVDTTDNSTVKERLRRAVELTAQQSKINLNNGPDFIMQHNELELEKLSVLRSIIADGFDPVITIRFNSGDQDMLLSNYIQSIAKGLA
jgi:hypothetical protein